MAMTLQGLAQAENAKTLPPPFRRSGGVCELARFFGASL